MEKRYSGHHQRNAVKCLWVVFVRGRNNPADVCVCVSLLVALFGLVVKTQRGRLVHVAVNWTGIEQFWGLCGKTKLTVYQGAVMSRSPSEDAPMLLVCLI